MKIQNSDYYKKLSKYQKSIVDMIVQGCKADCTEGENYKVWIITIDGKIKNIRKDSAQIIFSNESFRYFKFDNSGIYLKTI